MADGVEKVFYTYRSSPEDIRGDVSSWDRPRLEQELKGLCSKLEAQKNLVTAIEQKIEEAKKPIGTQLSRGQEEENQKRLQTLREVCLAVQKLVKGVESNGHDKVHKYQLDDLEKVLCEKHRSVYLVKLLELCDDTQHTEALNGLALISGNCDMSPRSFTLMVDWAINDPAVITVARIWQDLFRKPRASVFNMEMYPESHDDKWKISLRRAVPTKHKEYVDDAALVDVDRKVKPVIQASTDDSRGEIVCLSNLRSIHESGVDHQDMNSQVWVELVKKRNATERENIADIWEYYFALNKRNAEVALVLRPLWPLVSKDKQWAEELEGRVAALIQGSGTIASALVDYFAIRSSFGLSKDEVEVVVANAAQLGVDGLAIMGNLRCHSSDKNLVSGNRKVDAAVLQKFADSVNAITSTEVEAGGNQEVASPREMLKDITREMRFFEREHGNRYLLTPACVDFVARNIKERDDAQVMLAVCCVHGTIGEDLSKLQTFVSRMRALEPASQDSAVKYIRRCFGEYGKLPEELIDAILDAVEANGVTGTYFLQKTWQTWGEGKEKGSLVNKKELENVRCLLVGDPDTVGRKGALVTLAGIVTSENNDSVSPEQFAHCIAEVENGRPVVAALTLRGEKRGCALEWQDNLILLRDRYTASPAGVIHLQAMMQANFYAAIDTCSSSDKARLYRDFVECPDYESSCPSAFRTLMVYRDAWLNPAQADWKKENATYQALQAERSPKGVVRNARKLLSEALSSGKKDSKPLIEPLSISERAIPNAHALMAKFNTKLATISDAEMQTAVMAYMQEIVGGVKEDPELIDYFLSIADNPDFFEMYHTLKIWCGDNVKRDKLFALFNQYPVLKGVRHVFSNSWEVLLALEEICQKENHAEIFNFLAHVPIMRHGNKVPVGQEATFKRELGLAVREFESTVAHYQVPPILAGTGLSWGSIVGEVVRVACPDLVADKCGIQFAHVGTLLKWLDEDPLRVLYITRVQTWDSGQGKQWIFYPRNFLSVAMSQYYSYQDNSGFDRVLAAVDLEGSVESRATREAF